MWNYRAMCQCVLNGASCNEIEKRVFWAMLHDAIFYVIREWVLNTFEYLNWHPIMCWNIRNEVHLFCAVSVSYAPKCMQILTEMKSCSSNDQSIRFIFIVLSSFWWFLTMLIQKERTTSKLWLIPDIDIVPLIIFCW